jgi:hypothetical protein
MKKHLVNYWLVACIMVLVAACGKEDSLEGGTANQYYIKCKVGSVDKTFNINAAASKEDLGGGTTSYSIFGKASKDAANLESIGFTIQLAIPLANGTYKETDATTDYFLAGIYNPNTSDATKIFASRYSENDPFQITFTQVDSATVAGNFKGTLFLNNTDPITDSIVITNGSFKVKIQ